MGLKVHAKKVYLTLFLLLTTTQLSAEYFRWTHYGNRPLGMGNAFVSIADDYNALFYNPAGLARLDDWKLEVLNFNFELSAKTYSFLNDLTTLGSSGSGGDTDATLDLIENQSGESHHFAMQLTPYFITRNFGFGIGIELESTFAAHRDISAYLRAGPTIIMPVSFAMNFLQDKLSVGFSVKAVAKGGIDREFSIQDIEAFSNSDDKKSTDTSSTADENGAESDKAELEDFVIGGWGVGSDFGLLFTPTENMKPTIGISVMDIGATVYEEADISGEALGRPDTRQAAVNAGFSFRPIESDWQYLVLAMDAHAINQAVHYSKKFNLGMEWGFYDFLKLQAGLYQGSISAGAQLDVFLLKLGFVTYQEELGTVAGSHPSLSDRRYALHFKLLI